MSKLINLTQNDDVLQHHIDYKKRSNNLENRNKVKPKINKFAKYLSSNKNLKKD